MIFGDFPCAEAEGVRLAHTLKLPNLLLKKGRMLSVADLAALQAAGVERVIGARLATYDLAEDAAARSVAALLANTGITARPPYTGRCNLYAQASGVLVVDQECVDHLNRISEHITLATLRIVQESCTNIVRHALASRARVRLLREGDTLTIEISDNGRGILPAPGQAGFGLAGMRERVIGLAGDLDISSPPGGGTRIRARLPLTPPEPVTPAALPEGLPS